MKKLLFNISALMIAFGALTACAPTEIDDLFDESAATRLDKAVANYKTYFADKGGKWVMQYFCNEDESGYAFVLSFKDNGSVTIAGDNMFLQGGGYLSDTSLWDVIADNGPVLTFNTYNKVLHTFSDPADIPETTDTRETGRGHEGDYEFMIMETDDDYCLLHGKKTGYEIVMYRIDSTIDDEEYMLDVNERISTSFSDKIDSLFLETGNGKRFIIFDAASMFWTFYPEGGDVVTQVESQNCVATAEGIRFLYPLDFVQDYDNQQEIPIQNFEFQPDGTLLCTDDNATRIYAPWLSKMFTSSSVSWNIDLTDFGGAFATAYQDIVAGCKTEFKTDFASMALSYDKKKEKMKLNFVNGRYKGNFYLDVTVVDANTVRLSFDPEVSDNMDNNGKQHYNRVQGFKDFIALLTASDLVLSSSNVMCPDPLKVAQKSAADNYINVSF